jgi:hypothetical protein
MPVGRQAIGTPQLARDVPGSRFPAAPSAQAEKRQDRQDDDDEADDGQDVVHAAPPL